MQTPEDHQGYGENVQWLGEELDEHVNPWHQQNSGISVGYDVVRQGGFKALSYYLRNGCSTDRVNGAI